MKKNNEKGYTMIETLMYISLLIVLGGVLASYAHKVMLSYKTGRVTQQVIDLKKAIVHFTAADENYEKLSIEAMDNGHSLPLDMRTGDKTRAVHALGGEVDVGPIANPPLNSDDDNKNYMFFIRFKNLPKKSCVEILTQGQFYGDGSEMDTLIVNGESAWQYEFSFYDTSKYNDDSGSHLTVKKLAFSSTNSSTLNMPSIRLNITEALAACNKEEENNITWIFS